VDPLLDFRNHTSVERAPALARSSLASRLWWVAAAAWLVAVSSGFAVLWRYKTAPAQRLGAAPARWPAGTTLTLGSPRATLLVFAHPRCTCTRATLAELARIMARFHDRLEAKVVFWMPRGAPAEWNAGDLWDAAARIPGVAVVRDEEGHEAARFGAGTSGDAILYDSGGRLLFEGGITPARAHEGNSFGQERIASLLTTGAADRADAPVFGCALDDTAPVRVAHAATPRTAKGDTR
jgi:hypothetical protein